jgi:hypothetical protein
MKRLITLSIVLLTVGAVAIAENYTGTNAGDDLSTGSTDNTAYGGYSLNNLVTGKGNTALGMYAGGGTNAYDYDGTIKIGYMAGYSDSTSHRLFINTGYYPAYGIFGTLSSGYFGINNTSPTVALDVTGTVSMSEFLRLPMTYAPMPDTTGFAGGELWGSAGDSLYIYNRDHTIGVVYGK